MVDGERTIIENAVKGEASAFGQLYDHYQPKIYRFVLFKVSQREEAEDLTHEVFMSAWQRIRTYRDFGFPFSSWLYQIARNRIIDHYRTKKASTPIDAVDPEYFVAPASAPRAVEEKIEVERVRRALGKLKPEHQDVVIMRFIEELSIKETAAALGKTEGAIKLLQHRAMKALQELVD
ncbi:MAG: sigma-70 family RNA polymerase sigma factor [Candidatus Liptonbacteria bacterium]|nr:sigma-70 family RNA polymerase sigma factor [Candidatus Liptonbacteria bacterium]MBI3114541.1 sigma-70 family RNA polymerase sigma factor [Candidatus Harrisonbacteria bacterium]